MRPKALSLFKQYQQRATPEEDALTPNSHHMSNHVEVQMSLGRQDLVREAEDSAQGRVAGLR